MILVRGGRSTKATTSSRPVVGCAKNQVALFPDCVIWVREQNREWVAEDRDRLVKRDAVLAKVRHRLAGVPLELVGHGRESTAFGLRRRMRLTRLVGMKRLAIHATW